MAGGRCVGRLVLADDEAAADREVDPPEHLAPVLAEGLELEAVGVLEQQGPPWWSLYLAMVVLALIFFRRSWLGFKEVVFVSWFVAMRGLALFRVA